MNAHAVFPATLPVLAMLLAGCASSAPMPCETPPELLSEVLDTYPSPDQARPWLRGTQYMHVFVEGSVEALLTVSKAGLVENVAILQSEYQPVGKGSSSYSSDYFDDFLETGVRALRGQVLYQPTDLSCTVRRVFKFQLDIETWDGVGRMTPDENKQLTIAKATRSAAPSLASFVIAANR